MAVELIVEAGGKVLLVTLSGQLVKDDYARFNPQVETAVKANGKIRMLVRMHDFHGWSMGALWEDIKFDLRHFADIERLALVGDTRWEAAMAVFCKPFTTATIRYFDKTALGEALSWIHEGVGFPEPTKIREFKVLDTSADTVTLEEWQEWIAPGHPGRKILLLPTGLHVNKLPGTTGRYEIVQTGEELRTDAPDAP